MMNILITGATSGIGKATAEEFAKHGYSLILCGRREDRLKELADHLVSTYEIKATYLSFDLQKYDEVKKAIASLSPPFDQIDVLLNNAGLASGLDYIQEGNLDDWETMIDTNVKGLLYITRLVSPQMVARKSGQIINICSTAGKDAYARGNVYCATKAAVDMLTQTMRLDLYTHGIRVSQVAPGMVEETEFSKVRFHGDEEKAKIYKDFNPLTSKDVAEIIYFTASRPMHVNIQDILVMGTQQAGSNFVDRSGRKYD
ncbi:MAG: SDR family NAD(P)-dependent oxidoreductase [Saprospiraceae bacterium]|nr:SDR family NAD(P)-dependent oxidoreductase [Saprospiraceae bacterium]MBK7370999.1 SDR family NAD(P)-dependent oxidoreductase [Saprospiraceae bacterium]MBK7436500.1 SDR family NAD(P)-dependent oxidoreductase [Saprospiraceae bacterium]MBK8514628.1 SDR family NAD(P)-dependent oxidoreductase [Saprospiraceae bacterium]MBK9679829.1 SDR family NAD(P)-dependent oxidoreductase [Saprospiraceae bacterium]